MNLTANATEIAKTFGITKGRVSQLTGEGTLDGCFVGEGRARRYDPVLVAERLGKKLDQGQMLGNGASTQRAIKDVLDGQASADGSQPSKGIAKHPAGATKADDDDGYQLARTQKAAEEARRMRRQNELEEGNFVLASEVHVEAAKTLRQEISEFESVLREAARRVGDELNVDAKHVRQILLQEWRGHRARRTKDLESAANDATLTSAEQEADC